MSRLGYSRIEEHNRNPETDHLYDPLRTVLLQPQVVSQHRRFIPSAAMHSRVTHDYAVISPEDAHNLHDYTYIPINKRLVPTNNYEKVRDSRFMVVDAQERVTGAPISEEQMQRIRSQRVKEQKIVWDFGHEEKKPPKVIVDELRTTYRSPPIEEYKKRDKYKYNLYSVIDEPMNKIKQFGCGACSCPGNEIIASKNDPQSLNWLK